MQIIVKLILRRDMGMILPKSAGIHLRESAWIKDFPERGVGLLDLFSGNRFVCRLAVCGIESFGVGVEGAKAEIGAEVNRPPAVFNTWKILRISKMENSPAQGYKMRGAYSHEF